LVGAVFQPGSAHLFVNDTLDQFKECMDPAELIFGRRVYQLLEQLKDLSVEKERHGALEHFLFNYLRKNKDEYNANKILGAIQQIHSLEGNVEMPLLYKTHLMSERSFRRKFNEFVGMSPKHYSTIVRIKSFSKRYELSRLPYTDIINELGYNDQSHFSKDFQKIVGTNPKSYFNQLNKMGEKFIHLI
jgi:AraC-like DNA-binding protein